MTRVVIPKLKLLCLLAIYEKLTGKDTVTLYDEDTGRKWYSERIWFWRGNVRIMGYLDYQYVWEENPNLNIFYEGERLDMDSFIGEMASSGKTMILRLLAFKRYGSMRVWRRISRKAEWHDDELLEIAEMWTENWRIARGVDDWVKGLWHVESPDAFNAFLAIGLGASAINEALTIAIRERNTDVAVTLITDVNSDLDRALFEAVLSGNVRTTGEPGNLRIIRLLLDMGADPGCYVSAFIRKLTYVRSEEAREIVRLLEAYLP